MDSKEGLVTILHELFVSCFDGWGVGVLFHVLLSFAVLAHPFTKLELVSVGFVLGRYDEEDLLPDVELVFGQRGVRGEEPRSVFLGLFCLFLFPLTFQFRELGGL